MTIAALFFALGLLLGHCDRGDEVDEAFPIFFRWDWRDLSFIIDKTLPQMLGSLDKPILLQG